MSKGKWRAEMTFDTLAEKVGAEIDTFFARDSKLFDTKASEWAMAHRIAVYLVDRSLSNISIARP
jgi:hypothetical protein